MEILIIKGDAGSIHSLSGDGDRGIRFPKGSQFAVVLASYYGGRGYTTHRGKGQAVRQYNKTREYSRELIDRHGNAYDVSPSGHIHAKCDY